MNSLSACRRSKSETMIVFDVIEKLKPALSLLLVCLNFWASKCDMWIFSIYEEINTHLGGDILPAGRSDYIRNIYVTCVSIKLTAVVNNIKHILAQQAATKYLNTCCYLSAYFNGL